MPSARDPNLKLLRLEEIKKHNNAESVWIIIDDLVYDVTKFVMEHPGGEEVILNMAGQDATEAFNDVGHSSDVSCLHSACLPLRFILNVLHPFF